MNEQPHELTEAEITEKFLRQIGAILKYWENLPDKTLHEKMAGCVFSILAAIDGESGGLPAFSLAPSPHPSDKKYLKSLGENWYPEDRVNIAGGLHEQWGKYEDE